MPNLGYDYLYCSQCGAGVGYIPLEEFTPSEIYCPHCGSQKEKELDNE
jgi:DNA-directed RNA polymerase subunit RPC12/RpoP